MFGVFFWTYLYLVMSDGIAEVGIFGEKKSKNSSKVMTFADMSNFNL